jgi:hypothetical protein
MICICKIEDILYYVENNGFQTHYGIYVTDKKDGKGIIFLNCEYFGLKDSEEKKAKIEKDKLINVLLHELDHYYVETNNLLEKAREGYCNNKDYLDIKYYYLQYLDEDTKVKEMSALEFTESVIDDVKYFINNYEEK